MSKLDTKEKRVKNIAIRRGFTVYQIFKVKELFWTMDKLNHYLMPLYHH